MRTTDMCDPVDQLMHRVSEWFVRQPPCNAEAGESDIPHHRAREYELRAAGDRFRRPAVRRRAIALAT